MHHFNTQILPPLDSYTNEQVMHVRMIDQSAFPKAAFWGISDIHECLDCLLIGSAGC